MDPRPIELLAPAADKNVAIQAILHGADAVYIGGPSHGARSKASNSIEDIADVVKFAHRFRVRVYVTLNTLVYDHEIREVENLIQRLYRIGVDALIVQDMGILRMKIPPIALHASTQCDTTTVQKAKFLQIAGFSQIVLARELSIKEISEICGSVHVPVECFIHGALCVCYSGRCSASQITLGRSANRGECVQMCRMPYTLRNGRGEIVEKDRFLLSLRDFNASHSLENLLEAGVSSFKIEGRMKDADYVKNVTAYYRQRLDSIIRMYPEKYCRSSFGTSKISFTPRLDKSFNRGFTEYFLHGRRPNSMASLFTPKSMGEVVTDVNDLHNGDGISFFNERGEYEGVGVNKVLNGRIIGSRPFTLPKNAVIHRTFDREWRNEIGRETSTRNIAVDIQLTESAVSATDERGVNIAIPLAVTKEIARRPLEPEKIFSKLGGTGYQLRGFTNSLDSTTFIPASQLTELKRELIRQLDKANETTYRFDYRRNEYDGYYISDHIGPRENVANKLARQFYRDHGVKSFESAYEIDMPADTEDTVVMTTRYCLRRELGCCLKDKTVHPEKRRKYQGPLTITTGPHTFSLDFDCRNCEMNVIRKRAQK